MPIANRAEAMEEALADWLIDQDWIEDGRSSGIKKKLADALKNWIKDHEKQRDEPEWPLW